MINKVAESRKLRQVYGGETQKESNWLLSYTQM